MRLAEAQAAVGSDAHSCISSPGRPRSLGGALGACHGIDVPFVMGSIGTPGGDRFAGSGPEAAALQERVMDAWLGFARSGDPGHAGLPDWPPLRPRVGGSAMELGRRCQPMRLPDDGLLRAWDGVL